MSILNKFIFAGILALTVSVATADEDRSARLTIFAPPVQMMLPVCHPEAS